MNKIKGFIATVNDNKKQIIIRTAVIAGAVVAATLASGLFKVSPTAEAVEIAEGVAKAVKKAAE